MFTRLFFGGLISRVRQLEARLAELEDRINQLSQSDVVRLGNHLSMVDEDNCTTARFTGLNIQIVNGEGRTNTSNCKGNLIIGYNEVNNETGVNRGGSHNLVLGIRHNYSSYAGILNGVANTITADGEYCSIMNGRECFATTSHVSICNGTDHKGNASLSTIVGGFDNGGTGTHSVVVGGVNNRADGSNSVILGGLGQTAGNDQVIPPIP